MMKEWLENDPFLTTHQILGKLEDKDILMSLSTIRRYFEKIGLAYEMPVQIQPLTDEQKNIRVQWAQSHLNGNWNRAIFSDEVSF